MRYKALILGALLMGSAPFSMAQTNGTELSAGAAAVAVLAEKCAPAQAAAYKKAAYDHMVTLSRQLPEEDRVFALDSFATKLAALTLSAQEQTCATASKLRAFALNWGFAQFVR